MLQPKVVLAPIDFSNPSYDAVETAVHIASELGAALLLVHVVPALPKLPAGVSIFKEGDYERSLREDAVRRLTELSAKCAKAGVTVQSEVGVANDVGMEILRIAERHKADLIVISTHGMTGWHALVFGSVAEKVVRAAPSAVLLLKGSPPEKKSQ
jgi:nucleotide-binding universal stress UspA family protein